MSSVRTLCTSLVGLFLIFWKDHSECCNDTGSLPQKTNISQLKTNSDKQSLVVSWLGKSKDSVSDIYEIQISRTEKRTIIYSTNVSISAGNSTEYTWTWISDLPLECTDHSVRIRNLCNQSVASPWSNWITNYGVKKNDKSEIFPFHRVLMEGTSAIFCCVPAIGVNITSMNVGAIPYPLISIGDRVKAVVVHNLTNTPNALIKALLLTCTETTGKINSVWNYISFPPQKPRNLSCATSDMATITCTWDSDREQHEFDRNKQICTLHIQNSDQAPIECKPSRCTFPAVPELQEYNVSVVVKNMLGEEMESYSFNISDRVFPVLERVRVNPGVTDANVSWIIKGDLTQMNLLCQVSTLSENIVQLSCNSSSDLCKVTLDHLHPGMGYSAKVRCSANGRFWGAWTELTFFTTYPLVTLDLWRQIQQLSGSHTRNITLLWNPHIVSREVTVNIQGYRLQWSHEHQIQTEWKDSEQRQAEVSIGPRKYEFTVQAVLLTGSSIPVHITIPPLNHTEIFLVRRRRLKSTATGGFNLSWDEQSVVTCGYTVEWWSPGSAVPCNVQWQKLPKTNHTLFLPAEHFEAGQRYSFHIYVCTEVGHKLLEIQTGYSQELKSVQSPSLVHPAQSTSSSVTLEWLYNEDDPAQPAFIIGYLVKLQEVGSKVSEQAANQFNITVADPLQKSVTIEGLHQNQDYICSVSALTKEGPGIPASITIRTRINYVTHLAKILITILLFLTFTFLLWRQRKMLKSGLRKMFVYPAGMNIKTPEFDSFLYETGQRLQSQRVEECICCDIEILNIKPLLDETTTIGNPELTNTPCSAVSQSDLTFTPSSCVVSQTDYHPQIAIVLDRPTLQQMTCITNRSYLCTTVENHPE